MDNFILIGMPTCGKTTLGKLLAKRLDYAFLDTDDVIRARHNCDLKTLIDQEGREGFLRLESEAIRTVDVHRTIIATGGSTVYSADAMEHLKKLGRIVYLHISYPILEQRMGDPKARGVVMSPGFTLKDLYEERAPLYAKYADITVVELPNESARQWANKLIPMLK